jgi:hypothetical protein
VISVTVVIGVLTDAAAVINVAVVMVEIAWAAAVM